jgi:hypothetical protein
MGSEMNGHASAAAAADTSGQQRREGHRDGHERTDARRGRAARLPDRTNQAANLRDIVNDGGVESGDNGPSDGHQEVLVRALNERVHAAATRCLQTQQATASTTSRKNDRCTVTRQPEHKHPHDGRASKQVQA